MKSFNKTNTYFAYSRNKRKVHCQYCQIFDLITMKLSIQLEKKPVRPCGRPNHYNFTKIFHLPHLTASGFWSKTQIIFWYMKVCLNYVALLTSFIYREDGFSLFLQKYHLLACMSVPTMGSWLV